MSFIDESTLDFLLHDWLDAQSLTSYPCYAEHGRQTFDEILGTARKIATQHFAPHYKLSDREEPRLEGGEVRALPAIGQALAVYRDAGLFAVGFDEALGGLQLPHLLQIACTAETMAANISTAAYPMLTGANARLIANFGTKTQIAAFAMPQIAGRWFGTMCLSEPQAGSSLADITTRALFDGETELGSRYRLFGNKMWISGGDHDLSENIVHLVLAKVPGPDGKLIPGTRGISLFIVPKFLPDDSGSPRWRNDVVVAGLNHKMGYRGTTNCLLNFGEGVSHHPFGAAGAVGYRLGEVGEGLPLMFQMMNEARVNVGLGAAALACRGFHHAREYALVRRQGRIVRHGGKDPAAPPVSIVEHPDVRRMLLTQKAYAEGALALVLYCARLLDEEKAGPPAESVEAGSLLGLLTPIAKSWPSEFGLAANDLAIQVHGGYGYTRDFDVEQVYRDNRLNPIHEGTHGIQGLDLLGRKILRDRGQSLGLLGQRIEHTVQHAQRHIELGPQASALRDAWQAVTATIEVLAAHGEASGALDNAGVFLSAFGHVVVAWLWLDQAIATLRPGGVATGDAALGRIQTCRFFFAAELPKARLQLDFVKSLDDLAATMPSTAF